MKRNKTLYLFILFLLPFVVTAIERLLKFSFITVFQDHLSVFIYSLTCIGVLIYSLLSKQDFGWNFNLVNRKITAILLVVLSLSTLFFFSVLKFKGLYTSNWNLGWIIWLILVFREEFILRGIIQTKASKLLSGKWLGLSKSIWFSSLIFSLWHLVNLGVFTPQVVLIQIVSVFLIAGPFYGWIKEKTNNVIISYLCHISGDLFFYALYSLVFSKLLFPVWN
jgi:membrane protease YdiL (CAAX protease family)